MADGITPKRNLTLPEVGGSEDTWGPKLNNNFGVLDDTVEEAPIGGSVYGRKDGDWEEVSWSVITGKPATFPPTLPIAQSGVTNLTADLAAKAPLASPIFTGDPKAPTPATADNDTSVATTAFTKAAISVATIDWSQINNEPVTFPPTLPIPSSGVTGLDAKQASQDAAINAKLGEAPIDGLTYGRKDAAWSTIVGGAVISDAPPAGPLTPGQLWYDSSTGNTFLWYQDADSSQWVQQNIQPQAAVEANPYVATALSRNRIVNPAMQISQENGDTVGTSVGYWMADQWQAGGAPAGGVIFQVFRAPSVTLLGSRYRLIWRITTAAASPGTLFFVTQLEGSRIADFGWGSASARQIILRFNWISPAGTYTVSLRNAVANRTYCAPFTISAGQASQNTEQIIVVPGDVIGTWAVDNTIGVQINWTIASSGATTAPNVWTANGVVNATGQTVAAPLGDFYISDVGLYLDPDSTGIPPKWEMPDEAEELRACQRYWEKTEMTLATTITGHFPNGYFKVVKRISPAMLTIPGSGTGGSVLSSGVGSFYQNVANSVLWGASILANARM